jgi:predicted nucleic acid-binding protein
VTVFVDTSAFYAILDRDDANHRRAGAAWTALLDEGATLLTHNYILVETVALLQHRLGLAAVHAFCQDVVPLLEIDWVTGQRHSAGLEALLAAGRRRLSFVDCISFQCMRANGVQTAFCFDTHFAGQGFAAKPG